MRDNLSRFTDDEYYVGCLAAKSLTDGTRREVHLRQMIFNLRLACTSEPHGIYYEQEYCYHDRSAAWAAFASWDGESDPTGWFKNATTGEHNGA